MAQWKNRALRGLAASGLLEPKTKAAKLRALLPSIEVALANGSSYEACIAYLKTQGVEYSMSYFTLALSRARSRTKKEGMGAPSSEVLAEERGAVGSIPLKQEKDSEGILGGSRSDRDSGNDSPRSTSLESRNGVTFVRDEKPDSNYRASRNLEDLI